MFISGSNSSLLSSELANLLSGRYVEFEIFPFSYSEFCGITEQAEGQEYRSLKLTDDNFDKCVVSMDDYRLPTNEGVEHLSAWELDALIGKIQELINRVIIVGVTSGIGRDLVFILADNGCKIWFTNDIL